MKLSSKKMVDWVDGYINAQENYDENNTSCTLHWAINTFFEYEVEHPELCWDAILEIIHRQPSDKVFSILAAGPLEDLIEHHGPEFIERIEEEANVSKNFNKLLKGVGESSNQEIWYRVLRARK